MARRDLLGKGRFWLSVVLAVAALSASSVARAATESVETVAAGTRFEPVCYVHASHQPGPVGFGKQPAVEQAQAQPASLRTPGIVPGQHFLGSEHTQENFKSAFYMSSSSDSNSFEQWSAEGGLDAAQRANAQWKSLLADYEDPGLDPGTDEALRAFIAKRKESEPDRNYF